VWGKDAKLWDVTFCGTRSDEFRGGHSASEKVALELRILHGLYG